jgi:hypothetical protein
MDKIIELSEEIDKISNINEKVKLIKTLNELIEYEKINLNKILNSDTKTFGNIKTKIPIKYKKMSIDELEDEFNKTNNINDKIVIYLAIDKYYTNIEEELFD